MIEKYIKQQQAQGSDEDYSQRQETVTYSEMSPPPNFDVHSCYTVGGQENKSKNMFICGLTPTQIRDLKEAKQTMEAKI